MKHEGRMDKQSDGDFVPAVYARSVREAQLYCDLLGEHEIPALIGSVASDKSGTVKRISRGVPVLVPDAKLDQASEVIASQNNLAAFEGKNMSNKKNKAFGFEEEDFDLDDLEIDDGKKKKKEDDGELDDDEEEFAVGLEDEDDADDADDEGDDEELVGLLDEDDDDDDDDDETDEDEEYDDDYDDEEDEDEEDEDEEDEEDDDEWGDASDDDDDEDEEE